MENALHTCQKVPVPTAQALDDKCPLPGASGELPELWPCCQDRHLVAPELDQLPGSTAHTLERGPVLPS